MPALKTRKALSGIGPGERLEVRCTDPLASIDIPNLVNETGDRLEATTRDGGLIIFVIKKAEAVPV